MPDYNVSTVAAQIKPPASTSIGDMLNIARGAQAYQQAQQVNPLLLQQEQTAAEQAKFNLQQVKADKAKGLATSLLASSNWQDPAEMGKEFDFVERTATHQGLDVTSPNNPLEQIKTVYEKEGPQAAYKKLYQMTYGTQAPGTQFEGAGRTISPNIPGSQPAAGGQPGSQGMQGGQTTQAPVAEHSKPENVFYPVRKGGQIYTPEPSEVQDKDAGYTVRNELVKGQSNLTTARNNIDELIKQANKIEKEAYLPETGPAGAFKRKFAEITGDTKYQELSKDLANVQLANMKALGTLNTNEGLEAQKAASGSLTYGPDVIKRIAERTKADMTNVEMQASGAQKFFEKYGDNNMKTFQKEWSKNADTKIFQIINIGRNNKLSVEEKQKAVDAILGNNPEERKILEEKYRNIRKLEATGKL